MAWILVILAVIVLVIAFSPSKNNLGHNNEANQQIIDWAISVLTTVEAASGRMGLYACMVQVIYGNELRICIQDWYDQMVEKHGTECSLEKYFNLKPIEGHSDIYATNETRRISGSGSQFLKALISEMEKKGITGFNIQQSSLTKTYR